MREFESNNTVNQARGRLKQAEVVVIELEMA